MPLPKIEGLRLVPIAAGRPEMRRLRPLLNGITEGME
jgi:hypothetical protein